MKIDIKAIIIVLLGLVILYLAMCRGGKPVPVAPVVKPVAEQQAIVSNNEDSINAIIKPLEKELEGKDKQLGKLSKELLNGQDAILKLQQDNDSLLSLLKASELTTSLGLSAEKIREQIRKNDSTCKLNIATLNKKVSIKDDILKQERSKYSKLKSNLDTCLKNQTALEKYSKQIKPTNKVALGLVSNVYPIFGVGVGADFIHNKGYVFSGSVMTMQKDYFVQVGFKKIISIKRYK